MALAEYGNALNIDTDGSGNPILVDPDSGDTIAIYDRASGGWQVTEIEATTGDFDSVNTDSVNTGSATVTNQVDAGSLNADSVNTGSATVTNQVDAGSLNADQLSTGDVIIAEFVDSYTQSGDDSTAVTVSFTGLDSNTNYILDISANPDATGDITVTFNGVTTADYTYFDETGTKITSEPSIELINTTGPNIGLESVVRFGGDASAARIGLSQEARFGNAANVGGYADNGSLNVAGPDSIEITFNGGLRDGNSVNLLKGL